MYTVNCWVLCIRLPIYYYWLWQAPLSSLKSLGVPQRWSSALVQWPSGVVFHTTPSCSTLLFHEREPEVFGGHAGKAGLADIVKKHGSARRSGYCWRRGRGKQSRGSEEAEPWQVEGAKQELMGTEWVCKITLYPSPRFTQQIFSESLLCARQCSKHQVWENRQRPSSQSLSPTRLSSNLGHLNREMWCFYKTKVHSHKTKFWRGLE